jgi:hypothetical protein
MYIGAFLVFVAMVAPLFVLPSKTWEKVSKWLNEKIHGEQ